ncbi:NAD(P)-binding protein [Lentinus tigrinus ALCF2SS1-7]|uniref:NAD(P)-binding protein n=1 Tax=Lentinus tigrinus ALCF2SS1-6 TaxID=1328759 RepID=A0A5C2RTB5_9APHY|nr:NAD(P)-binding protein [Lentinus tigrinus ALCF2SS1-6]RPD70014.1 NAD(P)-binding protein [Lentinus tigrinus ALCF2SS1-7]
MSSSSSRVWLLTGTSTGFGLQMARCALAHGDKVVATLRKPDTLADFASKYPASQLLLVKLDVTNKQEVKDAFQKAKDAFGRVDVVFNNAGFMVAGEAEAIPDDSARKMFDTNFWGAAQVSQEAVRFFREENSPQGGYLIQNSASSIFANIPLMAFYTASKCALEGLTATLSKEVSPSWNIKFTSVEPGAFVTEFMNNVERTPQHPAYTDPSLPTAVMREMYAHPESLPFEFNDPAKGVEKLFELSRLPNPPLQFPLGRDAVKFLSDATAEHTKLVEKYGSWSNDLVYRK